MTQTSPSEKLLIERREAVTLLTINRPEVRNAVDDETMNALHAALQVCHDDGTRCVVLTGAGGAFSAGADLKKAALSGFGPEDTFRLLTDCYGPTLKAIRSCPWPVLAAVDGYAAGIGCDMALACDIRLVSARGRFAELFIRIGLIPDGGGTYLLPRIIGTGRALEMILTGDDVTAAEALHIGLANKVFPVESFMQDTLAYAERISRQAPGSLRRGKAALLESLNSSYEDALAREAANQRDILMSEDGMEGFRAFLEKRPPRWTGR
ncbi:MAG: enoyl-CoA hydratase/isomerase family protein [Anaerolineae bacterium]|nr:enoyl-CoA hydratase/isomerase family protein [Anaerolineae bacterium]NUQ03292.1 enoyl-CoA hydratase/isomerase family protein [Anaerolineae bacterium]